MMSKKRIVLLSFIALAAVGTGVGISVAISKFNVGSLKYSDDWIRKLSPADWEKEREIVRVRFCSPKSKDEGYQLQQVLRRFDAIKCESETPYNGPIYPRAREHGWNLYKPE